VTAHLERTLLLACAGVAAEVLFTALTDRSSGRRLLGHSYLWMFPIYALLYPGFRLLLPVVGHWAWPLRGALYAALILAVELASGLALKAALGEAPWEPGYRGKPRVVAGVMNLDYFPAWALGALAFERAYLLLA
jgi:hypothetical protein